MVIILRPYYKAFYYFYDWDKEKADKAFHNFERIPRDGNSDCHACERNTEIEFYLKMVILEKQQNFQQILKISGLHVVTTGLHGLE